MKIGIVADYNTTAYISTAVLYVTILVTVFAGLLVLIVTNTIPLLTFAGTIIPIETGVITALLGQREKFDKRTRYIDTLIAKIEKDPAENVGTMEDILNDVRTLSTEHSPSRWTLRKKVIEYYSKISIGLLALAIITLVYSNLVEIVAYAMQKGLWGNVPGIIFYAVIVFISSVAILWYVDKYYEHIISRMTGQKGPPKE